MANIIWLKLRDKKERMKKKMDLMKVSRIFRKFRCDFHLNKFRFIFLIKYIKFLFYSEIFVKLLLYGFIAIHSTNMTKERLLAKRKRRTRV